MSKLTDSIYQEWAHRIEWRPTKAAFDEGVRAGLATLGVVQDGKYLLVVSNQFGGSYREVVREEFAELSQAAHAFARCVARWGTDKHGVELREKDGMVLGRFSTARTVTAVNGEQRAEPVEMEQAAVARQKRRERRAGK